MCGARKVAELIQNACRAVLPGISDSGVSTTDSIQNSTILVKASKPSYQTLRQALCSIGYSRGLLEPLGQLAGACGPGIAVSEEEGGTGGLDSPEK